MSSTSIARATSSRFISGSVRRSYFRQVTDGVHPHGIRSMSSSVDSPEEPKLLYKAPMGDLITRLKRISITSCMISVIGLPVLIYLKNGTWPDAKQLGMGGFAFVSATGSTLALHFVFGPYILELYEMPQQKESSSECLYKATTRSIFGLRSEILFDPLVDVTRYNGARPFANFVAKGNHVLYCHPERLDEGTRRKLLSPESSSETQTKTKQEGGQGDVVQRPIDEQDGFL